MTEPDSSRGVYGIAIAAELVGTGVLTLRIPVAEKSKPRKITIGNDAADHHVIEQSAGDRQPVSA